MNSILRLTLLCSLLLHLIVYLALMVNFKPTPQPQNVPTKTREFVLHQPQPKPQKEPLKTQEQADIPPATRHIEDDINKANTSDGLAEKSAKQTPKPRGEEKADTKQNTAKAKSNMDKQLISSQSKNANQAVEKPEQQASQDKLNDSRFGQQLQELDDDALNDSHVISPLDRLKEEKARWRNMVLKRITEQVHLVWVKPDGTSAANTGVVKLDISADGYLNKVWVHLPSGDNNLDASILRAIRSIWRFQIPKSDKLNRYYRHLEIHYYGGDDKK